MSDSIDEYDTILPRKDSYKYQHIKQYHEDELISVFCVELILRYLDYHDMMIEEKIYTKLEFETDEEFEQRMDFEDYKYFQESEKNFKKIFGFDSAEIAYIFLMHPYNNLCNNEYVWQYKTPKEQIIEINLNLSKKVLLKMVLNAKQKFDENSRALEILDRINAVYAKKVQNAFKNFPKKFVAKKKAIIDALFSFDYVVIRNKEIKRLNQESTESYAEEKAIINKEDIDKYDKKQKLKDLEHTYKNDFFIKQPSLNTSSSNCYFTEEYFLKSNITAGRAKKNFYIIRDLITDLIE